MNAIYFACDHVVLAKQVFISCEFASLFSVILYFTFIAAAFFLVCFDDINLARCRQASSTAVMLLPAHRNIPCLHVGGALHLQRLLLLTAERFQFFASS
jgi:hypothetical protein